LDGLLQRKVSQASSSRVGRALNSLAAKIGGVRRLALLNALLTSCLGFAISFPIYSAGGIAAALPTSIFTFFLVSMICIAALSAGVKRMRGFSRKALAFAIIFSLPFGLLSLPLLEKLSSLPPAHAGQRENNKIR
jgi:type IV secretory pathway TrbD component